MLLLLLLVGASLQLLTLAALVTACGDVHRHGLAGGDRGGVPQPQHRCTTIAGAGAGAGCNPSELWDRGQAVRTLREAGVKVQYIQLMVHLAVSTTAHPQSRLWNNDSTPKG